MTMTQARPSISLYDLTAALLLLAQAEDSTEYEAALAELGEARAEKIEGLAKVAQLAAYKAEVLDKEIARLSALRDFWQRRQERIKADLLADMERLGQTRLDTALFRLSIQANPPRCEVTDLAAVPRWLRVTVPATERVDAKGIIEYVRRGWPGLDVLCLHCGALVREVPGAVVRQSRRLVIK